MSFKLVGRGLEAMMNDHDVIVQQYIVKFGELKAKFLEESTVTIEITVHRTLFVAERTGVLTDVLIASLS
jgi:hypothetical protein